MAVSRRGLLMTGAGVVAVVAAVAIYLGVASAFAPVADPSIAQLTPIASPTPLPTSRPSPTPSPLPTPSPSPTPQPSLRQTLLVLGSDADAARIGRGKAPLADSIMVASVNAARDQITVISIPRDTVDVPMPDGSILSRKINVIYSELGIDAMRGAVETLLGIDIDHYVLLNMDDFVQLTDAVGGVDVIVPFAMHDPKVRLSIEAGPHRISGELALKYVRSRSLDSDYGRIGRQQDLLIALARAIADPERLADPAAILGRLSSLKSDLKPVDLPAAIEVVRACQTAAITKIVLKPPRFATFAGVAGDRGWIMIPNVAEMRELVGEALSD